jgi:catechol 2,3-dioxygenase-like lactoylglutathione lyase family enzyme
MAVLQWYPCLCVDDMERAIGFYLGLLELPVSADVGWYVELGAPLVTVAFVERDHASVPAAYGNERGGVLVSVIVDDVETAWSRVPRLSCPVALSCRDEDFGQQHFMVVDPDGFVVDVIQRIEPSLAFRRDLVAGRRRRRS